MSDEERAIMKGFDISSLPDGSEPKNNTHDIIMSSKDEAPGPKNVGDSSQNPGPESTEKSSSASIQDPMNGDGDAGEEKKDSRELSVDISPREQVTIINGGSEKNGKLRKAPDNDSINIQSENEAYAENDDKSNDTSHVESTVENSSKDNMTIQDETEFRGELDDDHGDNSTGGDVQNGNYYGPTGRVNLEEASLEAIVNYIKSKDYIRGDFDEDEVVAFTHATHRHAENRTKYRKNLALIGDNQKDAHDRIYQEEEYFSLADGFFRDLVDGASEKAGFDIENRTLTWLKRAAGLQKPNDPLEKTMGYYSESEEEVGGDGRRRTRRAKKEKRKQLLEKEHEGLSIFADAINEIEEERGEKFATYVPTFPESEVSEKSSTEDDYMSESSDDIKSMIIPVEKKELRQYPSGSELKAIMPSAVTHDVSVRLLCNGKIISDAEKHSLQKWNSKRKRSKEIQQSRKRSRASGGDLRYKNLFVGDRIRVWWNEDQCFYAGRIIERKGTSLYIYYDDGESEWVDLGREKVEMIEVGDADYCSPTLNKPHSMHGRLEYGLPDLDSAISVYPLVGTDKVNSPLMPYPQGGIWKTPHRSPSAAGRNRERYEHFYPDLDAAWYRFDPNSAEIASLVPPGKKLTWTEWRAVRRRLAAPRRFSKNFIVDELNKRNEYRRMVRMLQQCSESNKGQGFPVPPLIQPGTPVIAYNKRRQAIHRGKVLFHSPGDNGYFVQFEYLDFGSEFCPDIEVSRIDPPQPVLTKSQMSTKKAKMTSIGDIEKLNPSDQSFERYSLVSLLATIERLLERKRCILDVFEENNRSEMPQQDNGFRNPTKSDRSRSEDLQATISAWLHANLLLTNDSLRQAKQLLTATYSQGCQITNESVGTNGASKPERKDIIDLARRNELTAMIIKKAGFEGESSQLQQCTEALLEFETRRFLRTRKSPVSYE